MIQSLYVLKRNGMLLYNHKFIESDFNVQILSGFLASIANFSQETLKSTIERVDLGINQVLILYRQAKSGLIYSAIIPRRDHVKLVKELLMNYSEYFEAEFGPEFNPKNIDGQIALDLFEKVVRPKRIVRGKYSFWLAMLVGALLVESLGYLLYLGTEEFYLYYGLPEGAEISLDLNTEFLIYLLIICSIGVFIIFPIPCFISGMIVGDRLPAGFLGFFYLIIFEVLMYYLRNTLFYTTLVVALLTIILAIFSALVGTIFIHSHRIDSRFE